MQSTSRRCPLRSPAGGRGDGAEHRPPDRRAWPQNARQMRGRRGAMGQCIAAQPMCRGKCCSTASRRSIGGRGPSWPSTSTPSANSSSRAASSSSGSFPAHGPADPRRRRWPAPGGDHGSARVRPDVLRDRIGITPACGLAGATPRGPHRHRTGPASGGGLRRGSRRHLTASMSLSTGCAPTSRTEVCSRRCYRLEHCPQRLGTTTFNRPSRDAVIDGFWEGGRRHAVESGNRYEGCDSSLASNPGRGADSAGARRDGIPGPKPGDACRERRDVERNSGTGSRRTGHGAPQA